jgi:hypothetical protein
MYHFLRFACLFLLCSSLHLFTLAQSLNLGYGIGSIGSGVHELENEIAYFNWITHPDISNPVNLKPITQGITLEYMLGDKEAKSIYVVWYWTNRHVKATGSGTDSLTQQAYSKSYLYRHNSFSCGGLGIQLTDKIGIMYSPVEIGTIRIKQKDGDTRFEDLYPNTIGFFNNLTYGSTYAIDLTLHDHFYARMGYYGSWAPTSYIGTDLISHNFNASRFFLNLTFMIHE